MFCLRKAGHAEWNQQAGSNNIRDGGPGRGRKKLKWDRYYHNKHTVIQIRRDKNINFRKMQQNVETIKNYLEFCKKNRITNAKKKPSNVSHALEDL